jgi:hypothetical protein
MGKGQPGTDQELYTWMAAKKLKMVLDPAYE